MSGVGGITTPVLDILGIYHHTWKWKCQVCSLISKPGLEGVLRAGYITGYKSTYIDLKPMELMRFSKK